MWKTEELNQFTQIIDCLISEGCEFLFPYNHYQRLNAKSTKAKQTQKIPFAPVPLKTLGDADFDPKAKGSSGLKVLYNSSNPTVDIIVDDKIHILGEGTTVIKASQIEIINSLQQIMFLEPLK